MSTAPHSTDAPPCALQAPCRNRYFYGKLLDVRHFDLESGYHIRMRRLLNRLVSGYGVVCGLDVTLIGKDRCSLQVGAGLAIDRHGREIIVPGDSRPVRLQRSLLHQAEREGACDGDEAHLHLVLCYHECQKEPTRVWAGGCEDWQDCEAGIVCEGYRLEFRAGHASAPHCRLQISDLISGGSIDRAALARLISQDCPPCPEDPCIPLANIRLERKDGEEEGNEQGDCYCHSDGVDITIRPICFTNDLLYQLLVSLVEEPKQSWRAK